MGLFDEIGGALSQAAGGQAAGQASGASAQALMGPLLQMLAGQGLPSLLNQLSTGGLGNLVQSWVGTGQNLPVTGAQLQAALGSGVLDGLAAKAGLPADQVHHVLAQVLPHVVDHMTPGGSLPAAGAAPAAFDPAALLGKLFG